MKKNNCCKNNFAELPNGNDGCKNNSIEPKKIRFYINGKEIRPCENFEQDITFSITMSRIPNEPHPNQWLIDMLEKQQNCDHDFCVKVETGNKCYKCDLILMQI